MTPLLPRYPVYVISKGRPEIGQTAKFLRRDGVPFTLVIEPQEYDEYAAVHGEKCLLVTPFRDLGLGSIPARNFVWDHAVETGALRHWILDDNIRRIYRLYRDAQRIPCQSGPAFWWIEEIVDRYENIGIAGMAYKMFGVPGIKSEFINVHVYSDLLIRNDIARLEGEPIRWRGRYNEDTDLCLQVLSEGKRMIDADLPWGWCTVLFNVFLVDKVRTLTMKGGNMDELYQADGRLRMARDLEKAWSGRQTRGTPRTVTVDRRFQRPQHVVYDGWKKFKTPLVLKPGVDLAKLAETPTDGGLSLNAREQPRADHIRKLLEEDHTPVTTPYTPPVIKPRHEQLALVDWLLQPEE